MMMPMVDVSKIDNSRADWMQAYLSKMSDHKGFLKVAPRFDADVIERLLHHFLLKELSKDSRFCVPHHSAWGMPYVSEEDYYKYKVPCYNSARYIVSKGCFYAPFERGLHYA